MLSSRVYFCPCHLLPSSLFTNGPIVWKCCFFDHSIFVIFLFYFCPLFTLLPLLDFFLFTLFFVSWIWVFSPLTRRPYVSYAFLRCPFPPYYTFLRYLFHVGKAFFAFGFDTLLSDGKAAFVFVLAGPPRRHALIAARNLAGRHS